MLEFDAVLDVVSICLDGDADDCGLIPRPTPPTLLMSPRVGLPMGDTFDVCECVGEALPLLKMLLLTSPCERRTAILARWAGTLGEEAPASLPVTVLEMLSR